jgi:hypothetical protein
MKYPKINKTYQHYKGGEYVVTTLATHTETKEILVIYRSVHFGSIYARPLEEWFELIKLDNGVERCRFIEVI